MATIDDSTDGGTGSSVNTTTTSSADPGTDTSLASTAGSSTDATAVSTADDGTDTTLDLTNTSSADSGVISDADSGVSADSTPQGPTATAPTQPYSVASWLPLVTSLAGDIPVAFAQAWNTRESGGNPCAFGNANAKGPDGNPLEMGLGQLYNPDNFQALGIDAGSWRAYCQAGTQAVTRDLTAAEATSQVNGLLGLIKQCRTAARAHNPGWSESSADFWSLVKLQHALPGLLQGMTAVTASLGHAPTSWAEFRATVVNVTLDAKTMKYSSEFARALNNAEAMGASVT